MQCNAAAPIAKKQCIEISCLNNFSIYVRDIYVIFDPYSFEVLNLNLKLKTSNFCMCIILNESLPETKSARRFNQSQNSSKISNALLFCKK